MTTYENSVSIIHNILNKYEGKYLNQIGYIIHYIQDLYELDINLEDNNYHEKVSDISKKVWNYLCHYPNYSNTKLCNEDKININENLNNLKTNFNIFKNKYPTSEYSHLYLYIDIIFTSFEESFKLYITINNMFHIFVNLITSKLKEI